MKDIADVFDSLKDPVFYKKAVKKRITKIILGASVVRAFKENSKPQLYKSLIKLEIDRLYSIKSEKEYDKWHLQKVTSIYNCLLRNNAVKFKKHKEGLKWGHATKVFNLFIGHLYHFSPYFDKGKMNKSVSRFLHVPLDSKVFAILKTCNIEVPKTIKTIQAIQYRKIQQILREAAKKKKMDPFQFDDYAWTGNAD